MAKEFNLFSLFEKDNSTINPTFDLLQANHILIANEFNASLEIYGTAENKHIS